MILAIERRANALNLMRHRQHESALHNEHEATQARISRSSCGVFFFCGRHSPARARSGNASSPRTRTRERANYLRREMGPLLVHIFASSSSSAKRGSPTAQRACRIADSARQSIDHALARAAWRSDPALGVRTDSSTRQRIGTFARGAFQVLLHRANVPIDRKSTRLNSSHT